MTLEQISLQMAPERLWIFTVWITYFLLIPEMKSSAERLGYSIGKYVESAELYYELLGEATLYNMEWKTVVYVSLKPNDSETEQLGHYSISYISKLCQATEVQNCTDFNHFSSLSIDRFKQIQGIEKSLHELI
jgi:hypothetical protein